MVNSNPVLSRARLLIVAAAVLWSLSGLFTRLLQRDTPLDLNSPSLTPLQIAFFRALFAGLLFVPLLRRRHVAFRRQMLVMVGFFAGMNASFLSAMALGSAANAIFLQNTAPLWVMIICAVFLGESVDVQNLRMILIGMLGVVVIVTGGWLRDGFDRVEIAGLGLLSAMTYAGVIVSLRGLRQYSPIWLTAINHLGAAACFPLAVLALNGPAVCAEWLVTPTMRQVVFLAFFGVLQMGLPYLLFAQGLKHVHPQEAGMITLIEPLLNPVWAFLISPQTDTPPLTTWIGGALIIGALSWRYVFSSTPEPAPQEQLPEIID